MIETKQTLLGERSNELNGKKWISSGLLVDQLRQRGDPLRLAVKRIHQQARQVLNEQGREHDLLHVRSGSPYHVELVHEWVSRIHLIVSIDANHHQMPHIRAGCQLLEQIEHCRIEPLQIVEKQREWVLLAREHAEEAAEHRSKKPPGMVGRQVVVGRLRSTRQLELRIW